MNKFLSKSMGIRLNILVFITIYYLVMMFVIWNINHPFFQSNNTSIYHASNYLLLFAMIINFDKIIKEKRLRSISLFVLIMIVLIYNSYHIAYGLRARTYVMSLIPVFMMYLLIYQLAIKRIVFIGFNCLLGLFFLYNVLAIIGAVLQLEMFFFGIPNILIDNYRYSSVLSNPNALGAFAFICLWISTYFMLKSKKLQTQLIYIIIMLSAIGALIVSMSRAAMLMTLVIYISLIGFSKFFNKPTRYALYLSLAVILITTAGLFIYDFNFAMDLLRLGQGLTDREVIWAFIIEQIKNNFIYGIGYGNGTLIIYIQQNFSVSSAHNLYLALLLEMGILAFLLLIVYIIKKAYDAFKYMRLSHQYKLELYWIGAFIIAFLFGQIFEFSFFKIGSMNLFVFIVFALFIALIEEVKKEGLYQHKVTHMITGLDNGGAESMLYKILKHGNHDHYRYQVISLNDMGYYGKLMNDLNVKVITLNLSQKKGWLLVLPKTIKALIGQDVLQTWLYHANVFGVIFGRLLGIPTIIWGVRQSDISPEHNKVSTVKIARFAKYISFMTTTILSCSDETTKTHQDLGYKKKKFKTIYNGFELDKFKSINNVRDEMRKTLNLNDHLTFVNVARYDIQKDHKTLLHAFSLFKQSYQKPFKLILCGIGITEDNSELMKLITLYQLEKEVIMLGVRNDIAQILQSSDYFVLSSLGEGFPNVLGEAMSSSLIPIVTDVGDCKMIVDQYGFVVDKQNPELLSSAILEATQLTQKERDIMSSNARHRIEEAFDIKEIVKQYEALYR